MSTPQEYSKNKANSEKEKMLKNISLSAILDSSALARLNTIRVTKPDKAEKIEQILLKTFIGIKMSEKQFIEILERIDQDSSKSKPTVKFDRRRAALDDSDEDY